MLRLGCNTAPALWQHARKPPGTLPENCKGMNAKQPELFSFSPPPARAWTCWQQGGKKMVLSPTSLLDKQDCALHQKSLCNFSHYFLGLPLLTAIKQLSLEYAIQINQLSAILLKLIIEGLHEPVRDWNMGMRVVQLQMFPYCCSSQIAFCSLPRRTKQHCREQVLYCQNCPTALSMPINVTNVQWRLLTFKEAFKDRRDVLGINQQAQLAQEHR